MQFIDLHRQFDRIEDGVRFDKVGEVIDFIAAEAK